MTASLAPGSGQPDQEERHDLQLSGGKVVEIASTGDRTLLRVHQAHDGKGVEVEIAWSPDGPVARVRAARLELETTAELNVRCARFEVEATGGISLRAGGDLRTSAEAVDLEARTGRIVARANDDVQLLGEQILLNCDRSPAPPEWVTKAPGLMMGAMLAIAESSGDEELLATIRQQSEKENVPR